MTQHGYETYGKKDEHKKSNGKLIIFFIFVALIAGLGYYAFYDKDASIHAFAINDNNPEREVEIALEITGGTSFETKAKANEIALIPTNSENILYVGEQKVDLPQGAGHKLSLYDFDGRLIFEEDKTITLDGLASKVFLDGIPLTRTSGKALKVSMENFNYQSFSLKQLSIPELKKIVSGSLNVRGDKTLIALRNDEIALEYFLGDVEGEKSKMKLIGSVEKLSVSGENVTLSVE